VDVDELRARAVLLEMAVESEVHGRRQLMVGARGGDDGSEYSFARRRWPVTRAETYAARRGEDSEPITWLGRRLRWMVVALDREPSSGWRRAE
jgi:hypothetical protein